MHSPGFRVPAERSRAPPQSVGGVRAPSSRGPARKRLRVNDELQLVYAMRSTYPTTTALSMLVKTLSLKLSPSMAVMTVRFFTLTTNARS